MSRCSRGWAGGASAAIARRSIPCRSSPSEIGSPAETPTRAAIPIWPWAPASRSTAAWIPAAARRAPRALSKVAMTPSPSVFTTRPPASPTTPVTSSTCARRTCSMRSSPRRASIAVESTKSLKTTIATPLMGAIFSHQVLLHRAGGQIRERRTRIELASSAWKAKALPLSYRRAARERSRQPADSSECKAPRGVAQSGSALGWGPSGRRFKSCLPDIGDGEVTEAQVLELRRFSWKSLGGGSVATDVQVQKDAEVGRL